VVDLAGRGDLRDAEAADPQPADGEGPAPAVVLQRAAAEIAAADPGDLHLLDVDGARLLQLLRRRPRSGGRQVGQNEAHESEQRGPTEAAREDVEHAHPLLIPSRRYGTRAAGPSTTRQCLTAPAAMLVILRHDLC